MTPSWRRVIPAVALLGLSVCDGFFFTAPICRGASGQRTAAQHRACQVQNRGQPSFAVFMGAGFGQGKAKKPRETPPSFTSGEALTRAALKEYKRLRREAGIVARVHARVKGTDRWFPVGNVCTEVGKTAEGVQGQKRLFLEHAPGMHAELRSGAGQKVSLEIGYSTKTGGDVVVCKAKYSGEKVGAALDPLPIGPYFRLRDEGSAKPEQKVLRM